MLKEEFLKLLPKNISYTILSEDIVLKSSILVKDDFGICKMWANNLIKGVQPSFKNAVDKTSYRLNLYKASHGDNFSYPNFKYTNNNDKLNIICNRCGKSDTIIECNHLKKMTGCKACDKNIGAPAMTEEVFTKRMKELGTEVKILEGYKGYHQHLLCRNKYGFIKMSPQGLLKGFEGSLKLAVDKTSYMIEQFKERHNNKYIYPNYEYCGNRCIGTVTCTIHGDFEQLTDVHLMGSGCTACSYIDGNRIKGYSRGDFIEVSKGRECTLYVVNMYNNLENFYKIGITSNNTEKRFSKAGDVKYNVDIVFEHKSFDAGYIWDLEKEHHKEYKLFHYKPQIYFKGITECFTLDLPIQEIIDNLKNLT